MKLCFVIIFLAGFINASFSQTTDFAISLLLRYNINENLCPELLNYQNLIAIPEGKELCSFRCNLNTNFAKADSIILTYGLRPYDFYDSKNTLELRQYYTC